MTSFLTSPSSIFETGIPVHLETIRATSSSSTSSFSMRCLAFAFHLLGELGEFLFGLRNQSVANFRHALQLLPLRIFRLLFKS